MWAKKNNEPGYGAIIDVHSGSVGIAIVYSDPALPEPEIIYAFREYIKISPHPDSAGLIRSLRHALFSATLQFSQEGIQALKTYDPDAQLRKLLVVCGAPWAHTMTRYIHVEDTVPFVVTEDKMKSLVEEAERKDTEELLALDILRELDVTLVERAIVNVSVNGYLVDRPYGKKVTELSLAHISGLIPRAIVEAVDDIENKVLTHTKRTTHTFALVLFCVLRDMYPHTKNAIFVDISGEATELSIMQDEVLLDTYMFPWGSHTLIREVANHLKTFPDEALGHIKNFSDNSPESVRLAVAKASEMYLSELKSAYAILSKKYVIPKHFFLTASRKLDTFFDNLVREASSHYYGEYGSFVSLHKSFEEHEMPTKKEIPDIFFVTESRFFHKLHGCGDLMR